MKLSAAIFSVAAMLVPAIASADPRCPPVRHEARTEMRQEVRHETRVLRDRIRHEEQIVRHDIRSLRDHYRR